MNSILCRTAIIAGSILAFSQIASADFVTNVSVKAGLMETYKIYNGDASIGLPGKIQEQLNSAVIYPLVFFTTESSDTTTQSLCSMQDGRTAYDVHETVRDQSYRLHEMVCRVCSGLGASTIPVGNVARGVPYCSDTVITEPNVRVDTLMYQVDKDGQKIGGEDNNCDADHDLPEQDVCMPQGYQVFSWSGTTSSQHGSGSGLVSQRIPADAPNCVRLKFHVKGEGYKWGSCQGHGAIFMTIQLKGAVAGIPQ